MGLFNFSKKASSNVPPLKSKMPNRSFDKLVDGDIPPEWYFHNRDFTEELNSKNRYFLNLWINSRNKSPKEQYSGLKSFVLFLNDGKKICRSKGKCHLKYFNDYIADDAYIQKRTKELETLISNFNDLEKTYNTKNRLLRDIDKQLLQYIRNNPGVLQKDLYHNFDSLIKSDISEKLYYWEKERKIKRVKSGNTYKLYIC